MRIGHLLLSKRPFGNRNRTMNMNSPYKSYLHDAGNAAICPNFGEDHRNTIVITTNVLKQFLMLITKVET